MIPPPPMLFSFILLLSLPTIILLFDSNIHKLLLLQILKCFTKNHKKEKENISNNDKLNNCIFINAKLLDQPDQVQSEITTFKQVQSHIELGRKLKLIYSLNGTQHIIVYNPGRRILPGKNVVLCPPYDPSWTPLTTEDLTNKILLGTLILHKSNGDSSSIDVTEQLQKLLGPLGDFHEMAGSTLGIYSLMSDVPDDIISASLNYYDGDGNEHGLVLPYESSYKTDYAPVEKISDTIESISDEQLTPSKPHPKLKKSKSIIKTKIPGKVLQFPKINKSRSRSCELL